jgi:hypothetical protein
MGNRHAAYESAQGRDSQGGRGDASMAWVKEARAMAAGNLVGGIEVGRTKCVYAISTGPGSGINAKAVFPISCLPDETLAAGLHLRPTRLRSIILTLRS